MSKSDPLINMPAANTEGKATVEQRGKVPPGIFIPTLYFAEGLPYTIVNQMSVVFYKNLSATNEFIGIATSFLYIPWMIKFLWAPFIDMYGTRRSWILVSQAVLAALTTSLSALALFPHALEISLLLFALLAFASATQDVAIDGYYMDVLDEKKQAFFVGVRNAAYKVAWLVGSGALVYVAGTVAQRAGGNIAGVTQGWFVSFLISSVIFAALFLVHQMILPKVAETHKSEGATAARQMVGQRFTDVLRTFFSQERIIPICTYILIFRLGDALMLKMAQPFLLDAPEKGGLGISTANLGIIYGTVGLIFLLMGGIFGGWVVSKFGLKRCLMPTALIQNVAILIYWGLAVSKPSLIWVAIANGAEQFAYGLGTAAYTVFLLSVVKPEYKAAHYAIATALMAAGLMIPGAVSGFLTTWLGYQNFFLASFLVSIPGSITILFLPIKENRPAA